MKHIKILVPLFALFLVANMLQPAIGAQSGSVGIAPANPDPAVPLSSNWFLYEAKPGDVIEDAVRVSNNRNVAITFQVDAVDAIAINDGGFALLDAKEENPNLGSWVTLEEHEVTLDPGEQKNIPFTVTVPENAEVGDHIGGLVVQALDAEPDSVLRSGGSTVRIHTRVGARMYLTVLGDIIRKFKLLGASLKGHLKNIVFHFRIKNLGNIRTEATADIKIYGLFGLFDQAKDIKIGQIFPKESVDKQVIWPGKERPLFGPYLAQIVVKDSYEPMTRADSSVVIPAAPDPIHTWAITFFIPYTQTLVIIILLFLVWFIRQFFVWRKTAQIARLPVITYKVKKEDHIVDIADRYNVSWKLVARINEIKAPYSIRNVKELYIPDASGTRRDIAVIGFWRFFSRPIAGLISKMRRTRVPKEYAIIVEKGDKRKDIEKFTGLSWAKIAEYNGLAKSFRLRAGTELKIPGRKPKH